MSLQRLPTHYSFLCPARYSMWRRIGCLLLLVFGYLPTHRAAAPSSNPASPGAVVSPQEFMRDWDGQKDRLSMENRKELQTLKEASRLVQQNRWAEAARQLTSVNLGEHTALQDYFLLQLGQIRDSQQISVEAKALFERLLKEFPFSRLAPQAAIGLAQGELEQKNYSRALEWTSLPNEQDDPLLLLTRAKALLGMKDYSSAGTLVERIYFQMPAAKEAAEAKRLLNGLQQSKKMSNPDPSLVWDRVEHLLEAGRASEAYTESLRVPIPADGPIKYRAVWLKGRAAWQIRYYSVAARCFKAIEDIRALEYPQARLQLALWHQKQKAESAFISTCQDLAVQFPRHPATEEALFHLANFFLLKGQTDLAAATCNQAVELFPSSRLTQHVLWQLAWNFYQQKQYAQAIQVLNSRLNQFVGPSFRRAAIYWLGRSYRNLNDSTRAMAAFQELTGDQPLDYYGTLAQKEISSFPDSFQSGEAEAERRKLFSHLKMTREAGLPGFSVNSAQDQIALRRILELMEADLPFLALQEMEHFQKKAPPMLGHQMIKAQIFSRMGRRWDAVRTMSQTIPGYSVMDLETLPRSLWEILYPLEHWPTIQKNSQREKLEPHLVAALIRQESLFQADAKSRANAIGLMQILPTTGRELARTLGKPFSLSNLYQAEYNIQLGTRYFSSLLRKFEGRWDLALAAYNAGLHRVLTWLKQLPADSAEFVESIPITETRNYVKNVLTHREHYRLLYSD